MWYFANAGDYEGPFQEDYLGRQLRSGAIHRGTLVWRDGMTDWLPLGQTDLAKLLETQIPWQKSPRGEPKITAAEHPRPIRTAAENPLEDYEQSGFEKPQLHRRRSNPAKPRTSEERGSRAVSSRNQWQNLNYITQVATLLFGLSAVVSFLKTAVFYVCVWQSESYAEARLPFPFQAEELKAALFTLTSVVFLLWFFRALHNLKALDSQVVGVNPVVAVVSFFAPIFSLFYPYIAMRRLWRGSFSPQHAKTQSVSPLVTALWLGWILGKFLEGGFIHIQIRGHELFSMELGSFAPLLPELLGFVTPIFAILYMRAICAAQQSARIAAESC